MPDADGDTVPDDFDSCADVAGLLNNNGCPEGVTPDFDGDGIEDFDDYCFGLAGLPEYGGCPAGQFPDNDSDDVPDFFDACYDQAGERANSGCPEGVTPDYDGDGIPDPSDACPYQYGDAPNNGCIADADSDTVPDEFDICPDVAGLPERVGCPADFALPDGDADGIEDPFDGCPAEVGPQTTGGCPDQDGDTVADLYDICPSEAGDPAIAGCTAITSASLPANRAPLNASNIANVAPLGQLRLNSFIIGLTSTNQLYLQLNQEIQRYDLTASEIVGSAFGEVVNGQVVVSQNGSRVVFSGYNFETGQTYVNLWDTASNAQVGQLAMDQAAFSSLVVSPDGSRIVTTHYLDEFNDASFNGVRLWDTSTGQIVSQLETEVGAISATFSPDGTKVLVLLPSSPVSMDPSSQLSVVDVTTGQAIGAIPIEFSPFTSGPPIVISPDGSVLVALAQSNTLRFHNLADLSEQASLTITSETGRYITNLAISPDGSLLLVVDASVTFEGPQPLDTTPARITVVDMATAQVVSSFNAPDIYLNQLHMDASGTLLISVGNVTTTFWGIAQ
jgi:hypothetical protein